MRNLSTESATPTLYIGAHPDDIEVMTGHHAMQADQQAYALVATLGRAGVSPDAPAWLC